MKKKYFYHQLISSESVVGRLSKLELKADEHAHLVSLVESSIHQIVLDTILSELSTKDKKLFLKQLAEDDSEIWDFLKKRIDGIEGKIEKTVQDLEKELHHDIDDLKS